MPVSIFALNSFQSMFTGNMNSYGLHKYATIKKGQKEKGESFTKKEKVTEDLYRQHLEGEQGLGIVPIQKNNTCRFAALDIDVYTINFKLQLEAISSHNMPIFPFRSKSGGLHLYLFLSEPMKVLKIKEIMEQFRVMLGLNQNTEIFPKQTSLGEGQSGNWINLPYYNHEKTKQYMYGPDGSSLTIDEAISRVNSALQTEKSLKDFFENLPLSDGPPCLQHIYLFRETSSRNEYLFNLARYYKTRFGDDFPIHIKEANDLLKRPITKELELERTVIVSHQKKDYSYKCGEEPILSLCAKTLCQKRKYGIGGTEVSRLTYEEFIKYSTDPPYYEWIINGKSLRFFSEHEIISQEQFRILCFREINILPTKIKDVNWTQIVNTALANIIIKNVADEEDISPGSLFRNYLAEFMEKRAQAQNKEQILIDRVYKDVENEFYIFKPKNLITFLYGQKRFRYFKQTEIQDRLRRLGGEPTRYYINDAIGRARVWRMPLSALVHFVDDDTKVEEFKVEFKEEFEDEAF